MNTHDQMDALRAHLDNALAGAGEGLPGGAAPALLQTARRRSRSRKIAATAGGAAVIAAVVIGVGSNLATTAGRNPTLIGPAAVPSTGSADPQPSTPPTVVASPGAFATAPVVGPGDLRVVAQRAVDPTLVDPAATYGERVFGSRALFLGPGDGTLQKGPGQLVALDLRTGDRTSLVSGLAKPLGGFTETGGNIYVAEATSGKPVIDEYSATDGAKIRDLALPAAANSDCNPIAGCLSDQVRGTTPMAGPGNTLVVVTPSGETTSAVVTFDLTSGVVTSTV